MSVVVIIIIHFNFNSQHFEKLKFKSALVHSLIVCELNLSIVNPLKLLTRERERERERERDRKRELRKLEIKIILTSI